MLRGWTLRYSRGHGQDVDNHVLVFVPGNVRGVTGVVSDILLSHTRNDESVCLDVEYLAVLGPGDVWLWGASGPADQLHPVTETLQLRLGRHLKVWLGGAGRRVREGGGHVSGAGLGQAHVVLRLTVVVSLMTGSRLLEDELAVVVVKDNRDVLLFHHLHSEEVVVLVPVVGRGWDCVSPALQHEPANTSRDIVVLSVQ